jgi:hypothetical protein
LGLTSAEGQKLESLNEQQIILKYAIRKYGKPMKQHALKCKQLFE